MQVAIILWYNYYKETINCATWGIKIGTEFLQIYIIQHTEENNGQLTETGIAKDMADVDDANMKLAIAILQAMVEKKARYQQEWEYKLSLKMKWNWLTSYNYSQ